MSKPPHAVDIHVGTRLKQLRKLREMSQADLAHALGITFRQVQKYEKGVDRISLSRLHQVAAVLNVPVAYFFENAPGEKTITGALDDDTKKFMQLPDALALVKAFRRIKDRQVRRSLVDLVAALAKD